jgi:hypothetical protein
MDYALPRADDLPAYDLGFSGTRCTTNPLGVKGCGEAGAVGAFPAVINAIADALSPWGAADFTGPATPEHVWRAIRGRGSLPTAAVGPAENSGRSGAMVAFILDPRPPFFTPQRAGQEASADSSREER